MKKIYLLLAFVLVLPVMAMCEEEDSGIRFNDIYGEVSVRPDDEVDEAYEYAEFDTVLHYEDRIRTKDESGAILGFLDRSTLALKENTIIVLPPKKKDVSKFTILAGKTWVNLKKMVAGENMQIEVSQAVAGIKGTAAVFSTDGFNDRIGCLHGSIHAISKKNGKQHDIKGGQQLLLRSDGTSDIEPLDTEKEEKEWQDNLSRLGANMDESNLEKSIKSYIDTINNNIKSIKENYKKLKDTKIPALKSISDLKTQCSRSQSVVTEANAFILQATARIMNSKQGSKGSENSGEQSSNSLLASSMELNSVISEIKKLITEIYEYVDKHVTEVFVNDSDNTAKAVFIVAVEAESLLEKNASLNKLCEEIYSSVEKADGQTYQWFVDMRTRCSEAIEKAGELLDELAGYDLARDDMQSVKNLPKELSDTERHLNQVMSSLNVIEVDIGILDSLSDSEDLISKELELYRAELDKYNHIAKESPNAQTKILEQSLRLMRGFAKIRRSYDSSRRIYSKISSASSRSAYKTKEYKDMEDAWQRIDNLYTNMKDESDRVAQCVADLEEKLNNHLR